MPVTDTTEGLETIGQYVDILSNQSLSKIALALITLLVGWVAIKALCAMLLRLFRRSSRLDPSVEKLLVKVTQGLLTFVLLIICMGQLSLPITSLVTLLGVMGLAASLALQDSLKNIAGGLIIMSTKPFTTGQFIECDLASGTVAEIGLVHTRLLTVDNRQVYVPNGALSGATITNYSREARRRIDLTVPVPLDAPLHEARAAIEAAVAAQPQVLPDPAPYVRTWSLDATGVDIMVRVWTPSGDYFDLRAALIEGIQAALREAGIPLPMARMQVHMPHGGK